MPGRRSKWSLNVASLHIQIRTVHHCQLPTRLKTIIITIITVATLGICICLDVLTLLVRQVGRQNGPSGRSLEMLLVAEWF